MLTFGTPELERDVRVSTRGGASLARGCGGELQQGLAQDACGVQRAVEQPLQVQAHLARRLCRGAGGSTRVRHEQASRSIGTCK